MINFSLLFGLIAAILMYFSTHRIFNLLNAPQILNADLLNLTETSFFIRQQDSVKQQNTPGIVRVWTKLKSA